MLKFYGTIEFLSGQRAAILTLTDQAGNWAGSGRIEVRSGLRSDLYEEAYRQASLNALSKGGRLERFSRIPDTTKGLPGVPNSPDGAGQALAGIQQSWNERSETCGSRVVPAFLHRSANALNIEPMQPSARCLNRKPEHWPASMSALRWIGSGGEALVFGRCEASQCPEDQS
jgi:hypothetical protein